MLSNGREGALTFFLRSASPCRGNGIEKDGWNALMDALINCPQLSTLNGCAAYAALVAGGCEALNLSGYEIGLAAERLLQRSASTLTSLNLRLTRHLAHQNRIVRTVLH